MDHLNYLLTVIICGILGGASALCLRLAEFFVDRDLVMTGVASLGVISLLGFGIDFISSVSKQLDNR